MLRNIPTALYPLPTPHPLPASMQTSMLIAGVSRSETCFDETGKDSMAVRKSRADSTYLEVSQLRKMLATAFNLACKRLNLLVYDLMSADVPALSKPFAAHFARVRAFTRMSTLMSLWPIRTDVSTQAGADALTLRFPSWEKR